MSKVTPIFLKVAIQLKNIEKSITDNFIQIITFIFNNLSYFKNYNELIILKNYHNAVLVKIYCHPEVKPMNLLDV